MTQEEITSGNKIIAEFIGLHFHKVGWVDATHIDGNYECEELKYHSSWDWIMPVVEKICKIDSGSYSFEIDNPFGVTIKRHSFKPDEVLFFRSYEGIESVFALVVEFIKWQRESSGE